MRNNLIVFGIVQLSLILLISVFFIALHRMPGVEHFFYAHRFFRVLFVALIFLAYLGAGKLMTVHGVLETFVFWLVPAMIWSVFLAIAYLGGGSEAFMRGPFRSLWRFPVDALMLPQVATMGLLQLRYDPEIQIIFAFVPQTMAAIVAWIGVGRYHKRKTRRRRARS